MAENDSVFIQRSVRWGIVIAIALAALMGTVWVLKSALTPLAAAFVLAYLLDPLIDRFEARKIPRSVAILILLALTILLLLGALTFLVPKMQREIAALAERLPSYIDQILHQWIPALEKMIGVSLPRTLEEGLETAKQTHALPLQPIKSVLGKAFGFLFGTLGSLVGLVIIPVIAFYFLVEFDRIKMRILDYVPIRFQQYVADRALKVDQLTAGFIRGQLIVATSLGILYAVGFSFIGIDLAIVIGLASGMLSIIPYIGGAVAVVAAVGMSLLQFGPDMHLLMVIGWYAIVQALEGFVLTPKIVGESLGLHPVTVIVALMIGGDLLGFLGLLAAVPVAAILNVFLLELLQVYRASKFYNEA